MMTKVRYEDIAHLNRRLSNDEMTAIADLTCILRSEAVPVHKTLIEKSIHNAKSCIVARNDHHIIIGMGLLFVYALPHRIKGHIENVVVHPSVQRQGVGRSIVSNLIRKAREFGVSKLMLTSNSSNPNRQSAIRLYGDLGFTEAETTLWKADLV